MFGLKAAIVVSLLWIFIELLVRLWTHSKPTAIFWVSAGVTAVFGGLELYLDNSFFIKIETGATNLIFAMLFGQSLLRERSLVQELAERREPSLSEADPRDRKFFFKLLTSIWTLYYLIRAGVFTWLNFHQTFTSAIYLRLALGATSFWILLLASIFLSPFLWRLMRKAGWMPSQRTERTAG